MFGKKKIVSEGEGTCMWIDEVGTLRPRVFKIVGRKEGKMKIDFGNDETYIFAEHNMRAKRIVIYKTSDGKVTVQNPNKWKNLDLKGLGIKELRFNLQNFGLQEGRAATSRWVLPLDKIAKLSPLFKMLMICIVIGVIGWASMKFGTYVLDVVMQSRLLECSQVLPNAVPEPIPIGALTGGNVSSPLGT